MSIMKMPQPAYLVIAETYNKDYQINPYAVPAGKMYDLEKAMVAAQQQFTDSASLARFGLERGEGLTRGWVIREDDFIAGRYENRIMVTPPDWWTDEFDAYFKA